MSDQQRQIDQLRAQLRELLGQLAVLQTADQRVGWISAAGLPAGLAVAPSGGIPGKTGAGTSGDPWVWGSAVCKVVDVEAGEETTTDITLYNMVNQAIEPGIVQWKTIGGKKFVDVEECDGA